MRCFEQMTMRCICLFVLLSTLGTRASGASAEVRRTSLLSVSVADTSAQDTFAALERSGRWWARIDDRIFLADRQAAVSGSADASHYYYAVGSDAALSDNMKAHRVGGVGRTHIFHLPDGPSALDGSVGSAAARRSAVSSLMQLNRGTVLSNVFPVYNKKSNYQYPLSSSAEKKEKDGAKLITGSVVKQYLKDLVGGEYASTRAYNNKEGTDIALHYLKKQFDEMGLTVCFQNFTKNGIYDGETSTSKADLVNLIGFIPGADEAQAANTAVVGAHYDTRPFNKPSAPGAEDNGSGVAALLAIARAYTKMGIRPKRSVFFVFFSGEEIGLYGSKEFATALKAGSMPAECTPPTSMLSMNTPSHQRLRHHKSGHSGAADHQAIVQDEVGWLTSSGDYGHKKTVNLEAYDWTSTDELMQHMVHSSNMHNGDNLQVVHSNNPFGSDHVSFTDVNIPSVLTINADDEAYPNYHQSSDTMENVDTDYCAMIARMNFGALTRISQIHE